MRAPLPTARLGTLAAAALLALGCGRSADLTHATGAGNDQLPDLAAAGGDDFGRGGLPNDLAGVRPGDLGRPSDSGVPPSDAAPPSDMGGATGCSSDRQCPNGVCDWLDGSCVPAAPCTRDSNCPRGDICLAGQCLAATACIPLPGPGGCANGDRCELPPGICVPARQCIDDRDCPANELCAVGYCQPSSCATSRDCNDGYGCVGGRCTPRRYCGPLAPCPRGLTCIAHVCN